MTEERGGRMVKGSQSDFAGDDAPTPPYGMPPFRDWTPKPRRREPSWLVVGGVIGMIIAVGVVAGYFLLSDGSSKEAEAPHTAPSTSDQAPVPPPGLAALLLSPADLADKLGVENLTGIRDLDDKILEKPFGGGIVDRDCVSLMIGELGKYEGTGYLALRHQYLEDESTDKYIGQAVIGFTDHESASKFVDTTQRRWEQCADRSVNLRSLTKPDDAPNVYVLTGPVERSGDMLTTSYQYEGSGNRFCQLAMTARNNVVVDIYTCGPDMARTTAEAVVTAIADRVTTK